MVATIGMPPMVAGATSEAVLNAAKLKPAPEYTADLGMPNTVKFSLPAGVKLSVPNSSALRSWPRIG